MTIKQRPWTGRVRVDDTALAVTDAGGAGRPALYVNGHFARQGYWRRVIAELGPQWRHVTYDDLCARSQPSITRIAEDMTSGSRAEKCREL